MFSKIESFLARVPAVTSPISSGIAADGRWWVKFTINIDHSLAWKVVQELGHVLNYVSIEDPLPTVFKPVSPPPYMNGGPKEYLSWVIESSEPSFSPNDAAEWLEGRLPNPVDDPIAWVTSEDGE